MKLFFTEIIMTRNFHVPFTGPPRGSGSSLRISSWKDKGIITIGLRRCCTMVFLHRMARRAIGGVISYKKKWVYTQIQEEPTEYLEHEGTKLQLICSFLWLMNIMVLGIEDSVDNRLIFEKYTFTSTRQTDHCYWQWSLASTTFKSPALWRHNWPIFCVCLKDESGGSSPPNGILTRNCNISIFNMQYIFINIALKFKICILARQVSSTAKRLLPRILSNIIFKLGIKIDAKPAIPVRPTHVAVLVGGA